MLQVELDHDLLGNFFGDPLLDHNLFDSSFGDGGFPFEQDDISLKQLISLEKKEQLNNKASTETPKAPSSSGKRKRNYTKTKYEKKNVSRAAGSTGAIPERLDEIKLEPLSLNERRQESQMGYMQEDFTELMQIVLADKPTKPKKRKLKSGSVTLGRNSKHLNDSFVPDKLPTITKTKTEKVKRSNLSIKQKDSKSKALNKTKAVSLKKKAVWVDHSEKGLRATKSLPDKCLSFEENSNSEEASRRPRTKWHDEDTKTLWEGILRFGNNWSEIKAMLPGRTYYQVKDKGRRLLHRKGWKTGRSKNDACGAGECAKTIAKLMLSVCDTRDRTLYVSNRKK